MKVFSGGGAGHDAFVVKAPDGGVGQAQDRQHLVGACDPSAEMLAEKLQGADPGLTGVILHGIREHLDADPRFPEGLLQGGDRLRRAGRVILGEVALDGGRQA